MASAVLTTGIGVAQQRSLYEAESAPEMRKAVCPRDGPLAPPRGVTCPDSGGVRVGALDTPTTTSQAIATGDSLHALDEVAELISARAFGIASVKTGELVAGSAVDETLNIASISKVLTFLTVFEYMKRESSGVATLLKKTVRVSTAAASVKGGTHAALRSGDNMLIHDLLYAMMLPSGNDAATALAEVFGKRMLAAESRAVVSADGAGVSVGRFVKEMNRVARRHGLDSIKVYNPHGMRSTKNNKANVRDVIRLMELAVQNPVFVEVYGTKGYSCRVKNLAVVRIVTWRNTNDMLWGAADGITCEGGKTGWIPNVHGQRVWGSLATIVSRKVAGAVDAQPERYIIVVLGCKSRKRRFLDSRVLARWAYGCVADAAKRPDGDAVLEANEAGEG